MPEIPEENIELTEDQKKILNEVYLYSDKAEFNDADLELARKMFDTPEKFALLRKMLQVFTLSERGITIPRPEALIDAKSTEMAKYAFEMAVENRADEKIRKALVGFYVRLRGHVQDSMKMDFEAQNKAEFEEKQRTEKFKADQEAGKTNLGPNL